MHITKTSSPTSVSMAADEREQEIRVLFKKDKSTNPDSNVVVEEDVQRCSSASAAASCSSSATLSVDDESKWQADRMVEIELDAARALADFAQLALLQSGNNNGSESSRNWGNKGRRSSLKKRVKSETSEWGKNFESSKLKCSDLVQESTIEDNQCYKKMRKTVTTKTIKVEQNLELPISTPQCSTSCVSSGGGRSKYHLTEAEREAKRLRRILANRESARQTIRRRQAMCEELTRKAAELAYENYNMKREKDVILKEYQLLKDKNLYLKAQIARSIKAEKEEVPTNPVNVVSSSSEKQKPLLVYNRSTVTPFVWSPIIQPLNPIPTQPLLHDHMVVPKLDSSDEQGNPPVANGLRPPFYIMPCPWFFPVGNGLYPHPMESFGLTNKQDDIPLVSSSDQGASLIVVENVENCQPSSSREILTNTKSPNNLPDTVIRLASGEENHLLGSHPRSLNCMPSSYKSVEPSMAVKCENRFQHDSTFNEESCSSISHYTVTAFSESMQGHNVCHSKKMADAAVAAEARKRRKELTKLKNLNGRQLRLQC